MRVRRRAGLLGLVAALAVVPPAHGQEAASVLAAAEAHYAPVATLCADFVQHRAIPLLGEERTGRGRLCQARPDRFAMRFTDPEGDVVVMDGAWVWLYWPSTDPVQVVKLPVTDVPGGFDLHREFLSEPMTKYRAEYVGVEAVDGRDAHRIRLRPLRPTSYQVATVWIETGTPRLRQVRLEEENGSVRTITLRDIQVGVTPPAGWFSFSPPPGAQVITG
ncbi:MAG: outer membrane lipoprotein carrier protein LolA [Longimicrobiales bacterium]